jgi:asparagine synthase (glutamine-hydrolysing)
MCGIAGWARNKPSMLDRTRLRKMCDVQAPRGPDDSGYYFSADGRVALGHRRLSIIDLSSNGHQPMSDEAGALWISYNGEIYNFRQLRSELEGHGHVFRSKTDTEVILRAYQQWGVEAFAKFNGMFAFVLFDQEAQQLVLVRDRFGIKPLYYGWKGGPELVFSSEIKAILESGFSTHFRRERVAELFLFSGCSGEQTLFEGIKAVRPGTVLTLSLRDGSLGCRAFYDPRLKVSSSEYGASEKRSNQENVDRLRQLLLASVERRLISDVPVGTLCSGGIDSSLITAMARELSSDVSLFTVSSKGFADRDEVTFARAVARHIGADLNVYEVKPDELQDGFVRATYFNDNPLLIINSVPMFYLSELARQAGVKVLLSGEGADELFGGYEWRHLSLLRGLRWRHRMRLLPVAVRDALSRMLLRDEQLYRQRFRTQEQSLSELILLVSGTFVRDAERRQDLQTYRFVGDPVESEVLAAMLSDLREYLEPLLMRQDRMTMAASVECRVPFLDYTVVESALNLPLRLKLRGATSKWIVKQVAEHYLPREVIYRPKKGFPVPATAFLYDYIDFSIFADGFWENYFDLPKERCREAILTSGKSRALWYHMLMFEVWGRIFLQHESLDEVREKTFRHSARTAVAAASAQR